MVKPPLPNPLYLATTANECCELLGLQVFTLDVDVDPDTIIPVTALDLLFHGTACGGRRRAARGLTFEPISQ